ncbi:hypothetical protein P775_18360 [Puniceibacterium antarcticum]|uniref:Uncharacterized protein n=1 Tax=Puniceibacterium antarcticum TaxID=1206336 RepID=A0A2G8RBP7_9RHOB|nr:hypothetical protein P775_18360 [Puniceibacterium antarcticum]
MEEIMFYILPIFILIVLLGWCVYQLKNDM